MPRNNSYGMGNSRVDASTATKAERAMVLSSDDLTHSLELQTEGMARLTWYIDVASGAPVTVDMQFVARIGAGGDDDWRSFTTIVAGVGVPATVNLPFPAVRIRANFTRTPGIATTLGYILGSAAAS